MRRRKAYPIALLLLPPESKKANGKKIHMRKKKKPNMKALM
jgi:hypothetical protein